MSWLVSMAVTDFMFFICLLNIIFFIEPGSSLFTNRKVLFTHPGIMTSLRFNKPLMAIGATSSGFMIASRDIQLDVFYANNKAFWDFYGDELRRQTFDKWTYEEIVSKQHNAHYIRGEWLPSLSKDPYILHWGHGGGYGC